MTLKLVKFALSSALLFLLLMNSCNMLFHEVFLRTAVIANFTCKWLLSFMNRCNVYVHSALQRKFDTTYFTFNRILFRLVQGWNGPIQVPFFSHSFFYATKHVLVGLVTIPTELLTFLNWTKFRNLGL